MKLLRLTFATLFLASFTLFAQTQPEHEKGCGISVKSDWLVKYQNGEIPRAEKSLMTEYVPMRMVVLGENDGTGYVDPLKLLQSFQLLNEDFASTNIQFYISDYDFLDLGILYDHSTTSRGSQLASPRTLSGRLNTFIVGVAGGACGYATPRTNYLVMDKDCMGRVDRTWAHEMGHVFTLPHTFYGWESVEEIDNIELTERAPGTLSYRGQNVQVERVDGSNCEDAADGFCDTEPDYLMERWACDGNGEYRDSLTDPDSLRFAVPGRNIMSYASDVCVSTFSEDQKTAMITNLASRNDVNSDESGIGEVAANGADMNLLLPEHNSTLPHNNFVELTWNATPNADYYIVQMNRTNSFNGAILITKVVSDTSVVIDEGLLDNQRYYWRVRPFNRYHVESDFGDQVFRFRNGDFPVNTIDAALNAAITVAPNPVSGGQELRINGRDLGLNGNLTYDLIDAAGRVLVTRENLPVAAAGFNERIATGTLPAGVYFLRLRLNEKLVTKRVVVTP
jgi:hypothetical protein